MPDEEPSEVKRVRQIFFKLELCISLSEALGRRATVGEKGCKTNNNKMLSILSHAIRKHEHLLSRMLEGHLHRIHFLFPPLVKALLGSKLISIPVPNSWLTET